MAVACTSSKTSVIARCLEVGKITALVVHAALDSEGTAVRGIGLAIALVVDASESA